MHQAFVASHCQALHQEHHTSSPQHLWYLRRWSCFRWWWQQGWWRHWLQWFTQESNHLHEAGEFHYHHLFPQLHSSSPPFLSPYCKNKNLSSIAHYTFIKHKGMWLQCHGHWLCLKLCSLCWIRILLSHNQEFSLETLLLANQLVCKVWGNWSLFAANHWLKFLVSYTSSPITHPHPSPHQLAMHTPADHAPPSAPQSHVLQCLPCQLSSCQ